MNADVLRLAQRAIARAKLEPGDNVYVEGDTPLAAAIRSELEGMGGLRLMGEEALDASRAEEDRPNAVFIAQGCADALQRAAQAITPAGRIIIAAAETAAQAYNVLAASHRELLIEGVG